MKTHFWPSIPTPTGNIIIKWKTSCGRDVGGLGNGIKTKFTKRSVDCKRCLKALGKRKK